MSNSYVIHRSKLLCSYFAFSFFSLYSSGSHIENWHSVLRNGLVNASYTKLQVGYFSSDLWSFFPQTVNLPFTMQAFHQADPYLLSINVSSCQFFLRTGHSGRCFWSISATSSRYHIPAWSTRSRLWFQLPCQEAACVPCGGRSHPKYKRKL